MFLLVISFSDLIDTNLISHLYTNNELAESETKKAIPFTISTKI